MDDAGIITVLGFLLLGLGLAAVFVNLQDKIDKMAELLDKATKRVKSLEEQSK